jgi:hypothetical protein
MIISFRNRFNFDGSRSSTCVCHFELYFFSFSEAAFALDLRVVNKDFFAIFAFNEAVASPVKPSRHCTLCHIFHLFCPFCLYFPFALYIPSFVMAHECAHFEKSLHIITILSCIRTCARIFARACMQFLPLEAISRFNGSLKCYRCDKKLVEGQKVWSHVMGCHIRHYCKPCYQILWH